MWCVSTIAVTATPISLALSLAAGGAVGWDSAVIRPIPLIATLTYAVARLILIAIAFSSIRALPPGAFAVVNWTTFIPHI